MATTSRGYVYPTSSGHDRLWEHYQNLADSINTDITAIAARTTGKPQCILRKSTVTSVANNGAVLTWDTEDLDVGNMHSTSVNTSRVTPTVAGWYDLSACVAFAANATGRRGLQFRKNGSGQYSTIIPGSSVGTIALYGARAEYANGTTDYFELFAYQDSGSALNTQDVTGTFFSVILRA